MSRSGYSDYLCDWSLIRWRGAVASSLRGARGQRFLRDLITGLDALPEKKLIAGNVAVAGCYCLMGVVGHARGMSDEELVVFNRPSDWDATGPSDWDATVSTEALGSTLGIARALALEAAYVNDDGVWDKETDEQRWWRVREWAERNLVK